MEPNATIETESTDRQMEPNATIENKCQYEGMVNALKEMLNRPVPSFSFRSRVERIPDHLRKVNEQAYSPMVISIGPIHHGDEKLQNVEKFKVEYLRSILNEGKVGLENLVKAVRDDEERIYCCYAGALRGMSMDEFFNVILVDAVFVLGLISRGPDYSLIEDKMDFIVRDLILLENQLPFFVLQNLFFCLNAYRARPTLIELVIKFFRRFNDLTKDLRITKIVHFTDLMRQALLAQSHSAERIGTGNDMAILTRSATQLHEAGVKFQKSPTNCLLDITFESGVLVMPCLELYDQTEALIRNVIAFEQYCFGDKIYVRDYCLFLDRLVNTTRDIDFLCDKGIIRNYLGDNDAATSLVNKLNINVVWSSVHKSHDRIFKELNDFYEKPWHKWKATLRHQYFSTPWRIVSSIAAIVLLVFTFIQTVCSIIK